MSKIIAAFILVLALVAPARATTFIADSLDEYGTPSFNSGTQVVGPYNISVCGTVCGTVSIQGISNPPWNPSGSGHYWHMTPGTTVAPNAGPGIYVTPGNSTGGWMVGFWFQYEGTITNANGGPFVFRLNKANGQKFGSDNIADSINSTGTYALSGAGTTTNAFSANTWYFVERCLQYGFSNVTGSSSLYVNGASWFSATGIGTGSSGNWGAANFNFDNEFGTGTFDFGPWYMMDIGTTACPASPLSNGHSVVYFKTYFPTANSTPLQFTPSAGSNFSNVNSNPAGANDNASTTQGQQDVYTVAVPGGQTGIVGAVLVMSVEKTDVGTRIALPLWKSGGGTIVFGTVQNTIGGTISTTSLTPNILPNASYNYLITGSQNSVFGGAWTPADMQNIGIDLLQ